MANSTLRQVAAELAQTLSGLSAERGRTLTAEVVDVTFLSEKGYLTARVNGHNVQVVCTSGESILVGDLIHIRQMSAERWSLWVYDGFAAGKRGVHELGFVSGESLGPIDGSNRHLLTTRPFVLGSLALQSPAGTSQPVFLGGGGASPLLRLRPGLDYAETPGAAPGQGVGVELTFTPVLGSVLLADYAYWTSEG